MLVAAALYYSWPTRDTTRHWQASALVGAAVMAYAREDELREVVLNLLENARFAGATWVEVRVDGGGERVAIAVRDTGHGMTPEVVERAFEDGDFAG